MEERMLGKIYRMIAGAGDLKSGVMKIEVKHDDFCPAIKTQNLGDCICNPEFKAMKPSA